MNSKSAINQNFLIKMLLAILPGRIKRLVFLASLAGIAQNCSKSEGKVKEKADKCLIKKLNSLLLLSTTNENALKFPIYISSLIWSNRYIFQKEINELKACMSVDECAIENATVIAKASPTWLVGDNIDAVINDVLTLFTKEGSPFLPSVAI